MIELYQRRRYDDPRYDRTEMLVYRERVYWIDPDGHPVPDGVAEELEVARRLRKLGELAHRGRGWTPLVQGFFSARNGQFFHRERKRDLIDDIG